MAAKIGCLFRVVCWNDNNLCSSKNTLPVGSSVLLELAACWKGAIVESASRDFAATLSLLVEFKRYSYEC